MQNPTLLGLSHQLLQTWCDGMLAVQVPQSMSKAFAGGLLCPSCALIHGRCADAAYPLLCMAHRTGQQRYVDAAVTLMAWSSNVSRADGSFVNDATVNEWQGITVFAALSMAEALHYHGQFLNPAVRTQWLERLARAMEYLDRTMTMSTGNINYPITAAATFAAAGMVLNHHPYLDRACEFAHGALGYFSNGWIFGEGHPQDCTTPRGCRAVDLGYNVEESLPALVLYCRFCNDQRVLDATIAAMSRHLELMLPDGAWDNSWGSRVYKWTWWGSRTSDGCQSAYGLLADRDPRFAEAARRNLELMQRCTHDGLLYGGPHLHAAGERACVHHTFTHAKALATLLDACPTLSAAQGVSLPRDEARGLTHYPEIDTYLVGHGPWRATITASDWDYGPGTHVSGGTLSLLYHMTLGPVAAASMSRYHMVELSNQQTHRDHPTMPLAPRIEYRAGNTTYTSMDDYRAMVSVRQDASAIILESRGHLQTPEHQLPSSGPVGYLLTYRFERDTLQISAQADAPADLILPIIALPGEVVRKTSNQTLEIAKPNGILVIEFSHPIHCNPDERVFNLVPGFQAVPVRVAMAPANAICAHLRLKF